MERLPAESATCCFFNTDENLRTATAADIRQVTCFVPDRNVEIRQAAAEYGKSICCWGLKRGEGVFAEIVAEMAIFVELSVSKKRILHYDGEI